MNVVEVKNLTKIIKKKKVLDDVSFSIKKGEILGIVGKNGAGKSTLLKLITGLYHPTKGSIRINGYDLKKEYEKAINEVGSMIEMPAMYDYMTGNDNLKIFSMMLKNVDEERIKEIVKLVSLEGSQYKKLKFYSLGMKQRLGLALALLNNPKLLILDEPTNGLDPVGIKELRRFLMSLKDVTIIISSHILSEIEIMCDKVMFIDKGKVLAIKNTKNNKYKFIVDDEINAKRILKLYHPNNNLEIEISEKEVLNVNKLLLENNIKVYQVCESKSNLEEEFLKILGEKDD